MGSLRDGSRRRWQKAHPARLRARVAPEPLQNPAGDDSAFRLLFPLSSAAKTTAFPCGLSQNPLLNGGSLEVDSRAGDDVSIYYSSYLEAVGHDEHCVTERATREAGHVAAGRPLEHTPADIQPRGGRAVVRHCLSPLCVRHLSSLEALPFTTLLLVRHCLSSPCITALQPALGHRVVSTSRAARVQSEEDNGLGAGSERSRNNPTPPAARSPAGPPASPPSAAPAPA